MREYNDGTNSGREIIDGVGDETDEEATFADT